MTLVADGATALGRLLGLLGQSESHGQLFINASTLLE